LIRTHSWLDVLLLCLLSPPQGRLNVVTMSAQEKEEKMVELVEDRMEQLHTLRRLLGVNSRGKSKAGSKRKEQA
jgi:hypothetical protein